MIAEERETVVLVSDGDSEVRIWTCRRQDITALKKKVAPFREGVYLDGTAWAEFKIPRGRYSVSRGIRSTVTLSPEERARRAALLAGSRRGTPPAQA